ncbi:hypothetical protein CPB85DRAFT_1218308, partial [Mucidula mucida]
VQAMYKRTGGKNTKHKAITKADSITTVSYFGAQLFQFYQGQFFSNLSTILRTKQFGHLFSIEVIAVLSEVPAKSKAGLELSDKDMLMYSGLKNKLAKLILGIKDYNKHTKQINTVDSKE